MHNSIIYVVYDGIDNPVFESQVVIPLKKRLQHDTSQQGIIVTFETQQPTIEYQNAFVQKHPTIQLIVLKKYFFVGTWSLYPQLHQLRSVFASFKNYKLIARGPFAGYLCLHALSQTKCTQLIIQVRGLVAAEYEYQNNLHKYYGMHTWLHRIRNYQLKVFERNIYSQKTVQKSSLVTFEAVSITLVEHLKQQYGISERSLTCAYIDIPVDIVPKQRETWRTIIRNELGIQETTTVFCYNGSLKPWQCPHETIMCFKSKFEQNSNSFLLVLTQDVTAFISMLQKHNLDSSIYRVFHVPHQSVERYLAACDVGFLFREKHLMNWVSRPTKLLEYKAVGLKIIHNNTIGELCNKQTEN